MKQIKRCLYTLGLVLLVLGALWALVPGGHGVLAQDDPPRPTPTNEGVGPLDPTATLVPDPTSTLVPDPTSTLVPDPTSTLVLEPTATPLPATATPVPAATSAPPPPPPQEAPAAPGQQQVEANPATAHSLGENMLPRTGFLSPGTYGPAAAAVALLCVIIPARYLRRKGKARDA